MSEWAVVLRENGLVHYGSLIDHLLGLLIRLVPFLLYLETRLQHQPIVFILVTISSLSPTSVYTYSRSSYRLQ